MTPFKPWGEQEKQAIEELIVSARKDIDSLQSFILAQENRLQEGSWYWDRSKEKP